MITNYSDWGADLEPISQRKFWYIRQRPAHSLGTKRAKSKYTSRPVPAHRNSTVKNSRHTKDSMPFIGPIPPHTPAIHRSLRLRRNVLTADTNGGGGPEPVFPALNNRSLARANSSSVNAPRARSSSSLFRSSLKVIAVLLERVAATCPGYALCHWRRQHVSPVHSGAPLCLLLSLDDAR